MNCFYIKADLGSVLYKTSIHSLVQKGTEQLINSSRVDLFVYNTYSHVIYFLLNKLIAGR